MYTIVSTDCVVSLVALWSVRHVPGKMLLLWYRVVVNWRRWRPYDVKALSVFDAAMGSCYPSTIHTIQIGYSSLALIAFLSCILPATTKFSRPCLAYGFKTFLFSQYYVFKQLIMRFSGVDAPLTNVLITYSLMAIRKSWEGLRKMQTDTTIVWQSIAENVDQKKCYYWVLTDFGGHSNRQRPSTSGDRQTDGQTDERPKLTTTATTTTTTRRHTNERTNRQTVDYMYRSDSQETDSISWTPVYTSEISIENTNNTIILRKCP